MLQVGSVLPYAKLSQTAESLACAPVSSCRRKRAVCTSSTQGHAGAREESEVWVKDSNPGFASSDLYVLPLWPQPLWPLSSGFLAHFSSVLPAVSSEPHMRSALH